MKIKSITKRWNWYTKVKLDRARGLFWQDLYGERHYIRHPRHFVSQKETDWLCENVFFHHYRPSAGDQVVDFGVGYGSEALFLRNASPGVRYLGVEAQPIVYECICNTFSFLEDHFRVSPFVVTDEPRVHFSSEMSYGVVGASDAGYVEVPTMNWADFVARYELTDIDLLKMNIEGAERALLDLIPDFSRIKRLIISCHDFRANHGHGEYYRTKEFVVRRLTEAGYQLSFFKLGIDWAEDYVFAERAGQ